MTFLLDQDVPDAIGRVAAQGGHTVTRLREVLPPDADDSTVLRFAHSHKSVLVTCNRDHFLALSRFHLQELRDDWDRARQQLPVLPITPLE